MKQLKCSNVIICSILFGVIITLSILLEFIVDSYATINDVVLYIPRLVTNKILGWDMSFYALIFMLFVTFLLYSFLALLVLYLIKEISKTRKKK